MSQNRLNGRAILSMNCKMDRKLDYTNIIHDFYLADESQESASLVYTK